MTTSFIKKLHSDRPAADRADKMGLYAWLIGSWQTDATLHIGPAGSQRARGEIHCGWVLEGRAIQDVWILPGIFYGTTLRIYDPNLDVWRIFWNDPIGLGHAEQIGRAKGRDIVQEGKNSAGVLLRWIFTDITPDSFRWLGERSRDDATWKLQAEFLARRTGS